MFTLIYGIALVLSARYGKDLETDMFMLTMFMDIILALVIGFALSSILGGG